MSVSLDEGVNALKFQLDDDQTTAVWHILVYKRIEPPEPELTETPELTDAGADGDAGAG